MGCTSSAPSMTSKLNTAEKSVQFESEISNGKSNDDDVEEIIYRAEDNDTIQTNVLPSCDTLVERVDLIRNKSTSSLHTEKDNANRHLINGNITDTTNATYNEEKIPKLEGVVEKVVERHIQNGNHPNKIVTETCMDADTENKDIENNTNINNGEGDSTEVAKTVIDGVQRDEHLQEHEATSPTQSESSRATRWEALADIAAELPPSLAVDPITGQIYALFK